jgi:hypothetical protein
MRASKAAARSSGERAAVCAVAGAVATMNASAKSPGNAQELLEGPRINKSLFM